MKVLFVEHGALVSGGQRSLLELLRGLRAKGIAAEVAAPPAGPLAEALARDGVPVRPLAGTEGSFKLHPLHTTRMLGELARMARAVRRHALAGGFDVVHANSVRAGLVCALAFGPRRRGRHRRRPAVVVHVRDSLPHHAAGRAVRAAISATADAVVAISAHTAADFGTGPRVHVVHNPVDVGRFSPTGPEATLPGDGPLLALIAQITPWKGQDDAIRALAAAPGDSARLAIVGEAKFVSKATRFDNRTYEAGLHALVRELGVEDRVLFTGEREDVPELLRASALVLVPSWEEPFGRTVIEAMATGTPVLATNRGGPPEIVTDGVDGLLLEPRDPAAWAQAIGDLLGDDERRQALGRAARETAVERFATPRHVAGVAALYQGITQP